MLLFFMQLTGKTSTISRLWSFLGVNHHNHKILFGTSIVTRETEETYVWLLKQLLSAMKSKHPFSMITAWDLVMKNAT